MKKGNLLIVDDEELIVKNLKLTLEVYADKVFTAANGAQALKILEKEKINCVICDISMPVMNGVELLKIIRSQQNKVPFIFYTAHGNRDLMLEAAQYGAYDFFEKPNLYGLEEAVAKGLRDGFDTSSADINSEMENLSEYKKLVNQFFSDK